MAPDTPEHAAAGGHLGAGRFGAGAGAGAAGGAAPGERAYPQAVSTTPAIRLTNVVKRFGELTAVDGLGLEVPRGTCFGLLGPNGAGKSTTMRMLTGQAHPTSGSIEVLGLPVPARSKQARALMGVVPQQEWLEDQLTCRENVMIWATLLRVPRARRARAVDDALSMAHLTDRADDRIKTLSGGMKRRLLIARSLVHDPELILLDEPTVGLDPQIRQELWSLIDELRGRGKTLLMSTHYIEEAERLADEVAIMNEGRVVARGAPLELLTAYAGTEVLEYYGPAPRLVEVEAKVAGAGLSTRRNGPSVSVLRAEQMPTALLDDLGEGHRRASTLEDVFVLLTGAELA
jgi:lipooligosaccharide transport system ATP-binding protein